MSFWKTFFMGDRTPAYSNKLPGQFVLTARLIVGGYVLYLAYGLKDAVINAENSFKAGGFLIAIICFVICGGYFTYASLRDYVIGRFVGGKLDLGDEPEDDIKNNEVISEAKEIDNTDN